MKITAFYIAEQVDLRGIKSNFAGKLLQENPSELFYSVDEKGFLYIFDYGAVVFANIGDTEISKNLLFLEKFCKDKLAENIRDDFEILTRPGASLTFGFDSLIVPQLTEDVAKISMLNIAYSVSLDFYDQRAHEILSRIHRFTGQMETEGDIRISKKNMIRFIGSTLNNKNRVIENLFIFDSPEVTWDDEYLDKIHRGLARTFEIQSRFKEIEYTFKVIEDNLSVFRELYLHRESSRLEWIIIALICIEVFDLIIGKIF